MYCSELFFTYADAFLSNPYFLIPLFLGSLLLKVGLLVPLIKKKILSQPRYPAIFLMGALICLIINDTDWLLGVFVKKYFLADVDLASFIFLRRVTWGCFVFQYLFLSFFIESLCEKQFAMRIRHYAMLFASTLFFAFFMLIAITKIDCVRAADKHVIELQVEKLEYVYALLLYLISLYSVVRVLREKRLPSLLAKQIKIISFVTIPYWLTDFFSWIDFDFWAFGPTFNNTHSTLVGLNTVILTFAGFYCARKIIGLRFLNFEPSVATPVSLNFVDHFKGILVQFSCATHLYELKHITQRFFKEAFGVPIVKCSLHIRQKVHARMQEQLEPQSQLETLTETFLSSHSAQVCSFLVKHKILIYDEIAFNNFYEPTEESRAVLNFLDVINADIFLPIYQKENLIAYIIVDRFARGQEFYSKVEHDEMLVFVSYVANMINLLQNKDLDMLIQQEKQLQEELYRKHQEVGQYKESIRSFLRSTKEKAIGIIFYRNRQFKFANEAAKELIGFNPNFKEGHPLTKGLKKIAQQAEAYKSAQVLHARDGNGNRLVISGVPHLEANSTILMVYHPEVADLVKQQIDMLKDPSDWDYLLYLETTKPGKLVNQLIPGSGEQLLHFKLELLRVALGRKATVFNVPDDDLMPIVELVHSVSLRERLHTIELHEPVCNSDIAIELFGLHTLFDVKQSRVALLEKLDGVGTLFIKNVHYLDLETQEHLAEFIRYGYFKIFKSEQKVPSDVRIVCSTNRDLNALAAEGTFSRALHTELKKTSLSMPSLMMLSAQELCALADGFSEQVATHALLQGSLALSEKDKYGLQQAPPESLKELRLRVRSLLDEKAKLTGGKEYAGNSELLVTDAELIEMSRLGKHVLRDEKLFTRLWGKVRNQNKIATLLGVNRSSVNRRCKAYKLI